MQNTTIFLKVVRGLLFFLWIINSTYYAFGQSTNASITGVITEDKGQVLPGATVLVVNASTGFRTGTITDENGRFKMNQLPLGGPYTVTVSFVGFQEQKKSGIFLNQGDKITLAVALSEANAQLADIVITDARFFDRVDRLGNSTAISANEFKTLPNLQRNFTGLADLNPLFSPQGNLGIAGQRRTGTNITLDGANARNQLTGGEIGRGFYTLTQEAIREFEVSTNEYSVVQGRQAGGSLNAVTKSGTNTFGGSVFTYYRGDFLTRQIDIRENPRVVDFSIIQSGFSLGGPILKDKLHFFVAYERTDQNEPFSIADIRSEADEDRLSIRLDTLERLIEVARRLYGLSDSPQTGQFERKSRANTFFARLDWRLGSKHLLTVRNNFNRWNDPSSVNDNSNINLFEVFSDFTSWENSTLISLRSSLNSRLTNELKIQYQHAERDFLPNAQLPKANIPRAIVTVNSAFPTENNPNATRRRTVQFGGQRFTPETNAEDQIQLVNYLYLTKGKYQFTFGTDNTLTYLNTLLSNEQNGRFFFDNINALEAQRASRYVREVPIEDPSVQQWVLDASLFGEVTTHLHPDLELNVGLRWDVTSFLTSAAYNPLVEQGLGLRTDNNPTDWNNLQPRLQLTWDIKGKNRDILRFGAGIFNAQPHYYAQVNNIQNDGTKLASVDVRGALVPFPDFESYRLDPGTVPGIPEGAVIPPSTINLIDPDYEVPSTFKANLNYNRFFGDRLRLGVNVMYQRGWNNYVYVDRNLVDQPFFRLDNENGRGIFVPASSINPSNGATDNLLARQTDLVGRTLELRSIANFEQFAVVVDGQVRIGKDGGLNFSYTYHNARDNSSYNCCVANTSTFLPIVDDPHALSWGAADNDFRQKVVLFGSSPSFWGFQFGLRFTGDAGRPFSFQISNGDDLNGDFVFGNELAFVFDPADPNTPENLRQGMLDLLNSTTRPARRYLEESFGQIAERNGGKNPFSGTIDVRLTKHFKTFGKQSLELSVDVFNLGNLLNRSWGGNFNLGSSQRLLNVTGFDPATEEFIYSVEGGAGTTLKNGTPYQVMLGARYNF